MTTPTTPTVVGSVRSVVALILLASALLACGSGDDAEVAGATPADTEMSGATPADTEVSIPADGLELAGTLRLPDAQSPYPGVVIAHGSGPQSRRGLAPGQLGLTFPRQVPVYEELAEALRDAGYAVLTFDKRTCGPFNGCAENDYPLPTEDLLFDAFVDDLGAVVDHLGARADVDEVIVLGHSKGGTVATELARGREDLAALVLVASPAVPIEQVLAAQATTLAELVEAAGQSGAEVDAAVSQVRELADEVAAIAAGDEAGPPVGGVSRAFWASWIEAARRVPDAVAATATPLLVVGGGNDWNVPPSQVEAFEPVLSDPDALIVLPDITHALTRLAVDDPAAITPADVGTSVDEVVIDTIVDWLDTTLD